ncbi:cell surface protein [Diplodia corticola]|uniref:Cell surface protein n=1 Tax=Diplodia corticola TaxID=236234 RepID=A0A1J9RZT5_9PEZI|nr:cell surface protein [Diplodia corticola]OJD33284.1 cell surface protein [Diplodia corticola]
MPSSAGQKVTDPNAPPVSESAGIITSDSLAAESLKGDGSFAAGNPKSGISSQSSAGTTANTTDTSAARTLNSALDAESRDAQSEWGEQVQLNAGSGLTGSAPTAYSASQLLEKDQKPKGKNITESDEMFSAPNASFNNEIGTKNDPGRVAEQTMQRQAQKSGLASAQPKDKSDSGDQPYSVLKETSA